MELNYGGCQRMQLLASCRTATAGGLPVTTSGRAVPATLVAGRKPVIEMIMLDDGDVFAT